MKSKRSKCKYTRQSVLKIIRHNREQIITCEINRIVFGSFRGFSSMLFGGSFFYGSELLEEILTPKPELFKLCLLKNK